MGVQMGDPKLASAFLWVSLSEPEDTMLLALVGAKI